MGQTCSDSMMHDLSNSKECSDAVTYAYSFNSNANYKTSGSWDNLYKGCVIYANGNMYFNSHSTGMKSHDTRSICKGGNRQFGTNIPLELFIIIECILAIKCRNHLTHVSYKSYLYFAAPCSTDNPCYNGGTCKAGICHCTSDCTGTRCQHGKNFDICT